jgi:hypothetical protein
MPDFQAQYEHEIAATLLAMRATSKIMAELSVYLNRFEDYFTLADRWDKLESHLREMRSARNKLVSVGCA